MTSAFGARRLFPKSLINMGRMRPNEAYFGQFYPYYPDILRTSFSPRFL